MLLLLYYAMTHRAVRLRAVDTLTAAADVAHNLVLSAERLEAPW
jgi:hypothetical protein